MKIDFKKMISGKGFLVVFLTASMVLTSCFKDDSEEKRAEEREQLNEYLTLLENQGVDVEKAEEGFYYVVKQQGVSEPANFGEFVDIKVTARALQGEVFATTDRDTAVKYDLLNPSYPYGKIRYLLGEGFTRGLNYGLQLMGDSAHYQIIVPSDLGYGGNAEFSRIPRFSTLLYDVFMVKAIKDPAGYERSQINNYLSEIGLAPEDSTSSGLYFQWLEEGEGVQITTNDVVSIKYKGMLIDGRVFGETTGNETFDIVVGSSNNIEGFNEGLLMMKVGSKARFVMPWYLGYGFEKYQNIPPFSSLIFEVEAVSIE